MWGISKKAGCGIVVKQKRHRSRDAFNNFSAPALHCTPDGSWTHTRITANGILSPACLPIPPPGFVENFERKTGLEPATPTLARLCSTKWATSAYVCCPHSLRTKLVLKNFSTPLFVISRFTQRRAAKINNLIVLQNFSALIYTWAYTACSPAHLPVAFPCSGAHTNCSSRPVQKPRYRKPADKTEIQKNSPSCVRNLYRDNLLLRCDPCL